MSIENRQIPTALRAIFRLSFTLGSHFADLIFTTVLVHTAKNMTFNVPFHGFWQKMLREHFGPSVDVKKSISSYFGVLLGKLKREH